MRDRAKKACAETKAANEALQMFKLLQEEQGRQLDRANAGILLLQDTCRLVSYMWTTLPPVTNSLPLLSASL